MAVSGGDIVHFRTEIDEAVRTLLMFDVVNLDEPVQKRLLESIEKEGILLYEKISSANLLASCLRNLVCAKSAHRKYEKYDNFLSALENLKKIRDYAPPYDVVTETELVHLFSICFEQAWKAMKEILEEHGYADGRTGSPTMIIKLAYQAGMIASEEGWLELLDHRNAVAHSYNEEVALTIIGKTRECYLELFLQLAEEIEGRWLGEGC